MLDQQPKRFQEHTTGSNAKITRSLRTPLAPLYRKICCSNRVMSHMQYYEVLPGSSAGAGTAGVGVSMVVVYAAVVGIGSCWALLGVISRCIFKRITHIERRLLLVCFCENVVWHLKLHWLQGRTDLAQHRGLLVGGLTTCQSVKSSNSSIAGSCTLLDKLACSDRSACCLPWAVSNPHTTYNCCCAVSAWCS